MIERLSAGFWRTALGPAVVIWGFGYVLVDLGAYLLGRSALGGSLLAATPMFALGVSLTLALDRLRSATRHWPAGGRWGVLLVAIVAAAVVQALFDLYWLRFVALNIVTGWQDWALIINRPRVLTAIILYLWSFALALTMAWAVRSGGAADAAAARAATAEASAAKAMAAALRLQLNPHFLFNTMNSISSLVAVDRKAEAEEMIGQLCQFLRASLNHDPMEDVSLVHEIDTIDAYLNIAATRFGDRLAVDIDVDPAALPAQVPNFILQPLVENAIKHGVALQRGQASLRIAAARDGSDLVLSVVNSMADADASPPPLRKSTGIGISNIRQRLANRYGDAAGLEAGAEGSHYRATIRMPFVDEAAAATG
jgi:two-component system, LytTR family, sensor kinase